MAPSGYAKKMSVEVSPSSAGAESNYAVKIALVKGEGTNAAGVGYLANNCLNWPNDIRFCNNNGDDLSFYREESDGTDGTWWIKVDSIPTGSNTTIWVYFGKTADSDASSMANTFIFGDDFESGNLNAWTTAEAGWSAQGTTKYDGSYAAKSVYNTNRTLSKTISPGRSVLYHAYVRMKTVSWASYLMVPNCTTAGMLYALVAYGYYFRYYTGGGYQDLPTQTAYSLDTWYKAEVAIDNANQRFRWWINGASKGSATLKNGSGTTVGTTDYPISCKSLGDSNSGGEFYLDKVWVRPYIYPEPAVGTPGSIQDVGSSIIPIMMAHRKRRIA